MVKKADPGMGASPMFAPGMPLPGWDNIFRFLARFFSPPKLRPR